MADKPQQERRYLGLPAHEWVRMVIGTVLLTIVVQIFLAWFNRTSPYIAYNVSSPIVFDGLQHQFAIVNLQLTNHGSKESDVVDILYVTEAKEIQEIVFSSHLLKPIKGNGNPSASFPIPFINIGDTISVSILVKDAANIFNTKKIEVSCKGAKIKMIDLDEKNATTLSILDKWFNIGTAIAIWMLMIGYCYRTRKFNSDRQIWLETRRAIWLSKHGKSIPPRPKWAEYAAPNFVTPSPATADAPKTQPPLD